MARGARPIARVRLARSYPRLLARPLLLLLAAGGLVASGVVLVPGAAGLALAAGGAVLGLLALLLAVAPFRVRVQVEESVVRVSSLFSRRVFLLTPGSLTRIHLRGEGASSLRTGFSLGWANGRATLREDEEVYVVRLAPTESVILVPTARGRLAIATSDEPHLIDALSRAARARARSEELEAAMAAEEAAAEEAAAIARRDPGAGPPSELDPRLMTGIERSLYEGGVARDTAAGDAGAAALQDAPAPQGPALAAEPTPEIAAEPEPRGILRRPSWAQRRPGSASGGLPALPSPATRTRPSVAFRVRRPRPSWLLPLVPLVAAGAAWGIAAAMDQMPMAGTASARLTALALILAGPATTIGAIMARAWWPRLVGVVVTGGLASTIFIGRSLLPL